MDFNEAQSAIERCISTLKKNVFDKVELLSQTEEYIEAIELLKSLNENLPGDQEIISKDHKVADLTIDVLKDLVGLIKVDLTTNVLKDQIKQNHF